MKILTTEQYKEAIENVLLDRQIRTLQILYHCPGSSATAKELAQKVHPPKPAPIIASGSIGRLGRRIADYWQMVPENYYDGRKERPRYFTLVSRVYDPRVGWTMYENLQRALEELKLVNGQGTEVIERLPTEAAPFEEERFYREGKMVQVFVNRFERNQNARIECIKHYGCKCYACNFDFEVAYGRLAKGFIHVHHHIPLHETKEEYNVNPIKDLIPLCANCHSVIHLSKPILDVEELRKLVNKKHN